MAKYLIKANYKTKGTKGLMKDGGSGRRTAVKQAIEALGGKLESFYFAYGDVDAYVIFDLPDTASSLALSLAVNASGAVNISTIPLFTPDEIDGAAKKVVAYRAPGADAPAKGKGQGKK
jgi:uncharacterized protein with GYD domain